MKYPKLVRYSIVGAPAFAVLCTYTVLVLFVYQRLFAANSVDRMSAGPIAIVLSPTSVYAAATFAPTLARAEPTLESSATPTVPTETRTPAPSETTRLTDTPIPISTATYSPTSLPTTTRTMPSTRASTETVAPSATPQALSTLAPALARRAPATALFAQIPFVLVAGEPGPTFSGARRDAVTSTPTGAPARPPTPTTTSTRAASPGPGPLGAARTVSVPLPGSLDAPPLAFALPSEPVNCTHPADIPMPITWSIKLCANETYGPMVVRGERIGIFGDEKGTAVIRAGGREFGITGEGARLAFVRLVIRGTTHPADSGTILCLYPACGSAPGGAFYGGGILIHAPDSIVFDSTITGAVSGVAAENVRGLLLVNNRLDNLSGWGSYNNRVRESVFVGNSFNNDNRSCVIGGAGNLSDGCESAGWLCLVCMNNLIAENTCTGSGDCYYANGEGGGGSNNNRLHRNTCYASPHNCFELTFSVGNEFVDNVAAADPNTNQNCLYPFWIGGSQVIFGFNKWQCTISPEKSLNHARDSTPVETRIDRK